MAVERRFTELPLAVLMSADMKKKIQQIAKEEKVSISEVIRESIDAGIDRRYKRKAATRG